VTDLAPRLKAALRDPALIRQAGRFVVDARASTRFDAPPPALNR
jgi:hypothetical protein